MKACPSSWPCKICRWEGAYDLQHISYAWFEMSLGAQHAQAPRSVSDYIFAANSYWSPDVIVPGVLLKLLHSKWCVKRGYLRLHLPGGFGRPDMNANKCLKLFLLGTPAASAPPFRRAPALHHRTQ